MYGDYRFYIVDKELTSPFVCKKNVAELRKFVKKKVNK